MSAARSKIAIKAKTSRWRPIDKTERHRIMATATASKKKTKLKFRPMDDRVLVDPLDAVEMTTGGIILPDAAREKPQRGIVVAQGPGKLLDSGARGEMSVSVGDEVFYGKYAGTEVEMGTDTFVVLRENDILAIVEN